MSGSDDIRLLVEISHMYYDDQLTQQQIAKKMNKVLIHLHRYNKVLHKIKNNIQQHWMMVQN